MCTYHEAGLPNITGTFRGIGPFGENAYGSWYGNPGLSDIFRYTDVWSSSVHCGTASHSDVAQIALDVSKGFPIYGKSDTVQPNSCVINFYIKAK